MAVHGLCASAFVVDQTFHCLPLATACLRDRAPARRAFRAFRTPAARVGQIGLLHLVTTERFDSAHLDQHQLHFSNQHCQQTPVFESFRAQQRQFTRLRPAITRWQASHEPYLPSRTRLPLFASIEPPPVPFCQQTPQHPDIS